jgi:hypothetical protein
MRMLDGRKDIMFEDDGDDEMTGIILMVMTVRYIVKWSRFFCNVPRLRRFPSFAMFATFATHEVVVEMIDIAQEIVDVHGQKLEVERDNAVDGFNDVVSRIRRFDAGLRRCVDRC